jgi:hypothetical protein
MGDFQMSTNHTQEIKFYNMDEWPNKKATQITAEISKENYNGSKMDKVKIIFGMVQKKEGRKEQFVVEVQRLGLFNLPKQKTFFTYNDGDTINSADDTAKITTTTFKKVPNTFNLAWQDDKEIVTMPTNSEALVEQYQAAGLDTRRIQKILYEFGIQHKVISSKLSNKVQAAFAFAEPERSVL